MTLSETTPRLPDSIDGIIATLALTDTGRTATGTRVYAGHWHGHTPPWHDGDAYYFSDYLPPSFAAITPADINWYRGAWYSNELCCSISWTEGDVCLAVSTSPEALIDERVAA